MRISYYALALILLISLPLSAKAQDYAPKKTWAPTETKRDIKPFNLKGILRGTKSKRKKNYRKAGPNTRNTREILREGGELPFTQALMETADYNALRDGIRRSNTFDGKTDQQAAILLADIKEDMAANMDAMERRRNEFYIRRGIADDRTREYLRSKQGRLFKKVVRDEKKEKREEMKRKAQELLARREKQKENASPGIGYIDVEETSSGSNKVVVPTAKPGKDGKIKPFFYR